MRRIESEHLADDDERDVTRKVLDELELTDRIVGVLGDDLVQQFVRQLPDVRGEVADPARREALVDQPTLPDVLIAVEGDDRHVSGDLGADAVPAAVGLLVTGDGEHVLVSCRDVEIVGLVLVERGQLADGPVDLPRIVVGSGITEIWSWCERRGHLCSITN